MKIAYYYGIWLDNMCSLFSEKFLVLTSSRSIVWWKPLGKKDSLRLTKTYRELCYFVLSILPVSSTIITSISIVYSDFKYIREPLFIVYNVLSKSVCYRCSCCCWFFSSLIAGVFVVAVKAGINFSRILDFQNGILPRQTLSNDMHCVTTRDYNEIHYNLRRGVYQKNRLTINPRQRISEIYSHRTLISLNCHSP